MPVNADGTVTFYDPATNSYYYATAGDYQQIAGAEETAAAGATFGADGMNGYYQAAGGSTALDGAGGVDSFGGIKTWTRPRHRRQSDKANGAFLRGLGGPNLGRTSRHTTVVWASIERASSIRFVTVPAVVSKTTEQVRYLLSGLQTSARSNDSLLTSSFGRLHWMIARSFSLFADS